MASRFMEHCECIKHSEQYKLHWVFIIANDWHIAKLEVYDNQFLEDWWNCEGN